MAENIKSNNRTGRVGVAPSLDAASLQTLSVSLGGEGFTFAAGTETTLQGLLTNGFVLEESTATSLALEMRGNEALKARVEAGWPTEKDALDGLINDPTDRQPNDYAKELGLTRSETKVLAHTLYSEGKITKNAFNWVANDELPTIGNIEGVAEHLQGQTIEAIRTALTNEESGRVEINKDNAQAVFGVSWETILRERKFEDNLDVEPRVEQTPPRVLNERNPTISRREYRKGAAPPEDRRQPQKGVGDLPEHLAARVGPNAVRRGDDVVLSGPAYKGAPGLEEAIAARRDIYLTAAKVLGDDMPQDKIDPEELRKLVASRIGENMAAKRAAAGMSFGDTRGLSGDRRERSASDFAKMAMSRFEASNPKINVSKRPSPVNSKSAPASEELGDANAVLVAAPEESSGDVVTEPKHDCYDHGPPPPDRVLELQALLAKTVAELSSYLDRGDGDEFLGHVHECECMNKNRSTALSAIESRMKEVHPKEDVPQRDDYPKEDRYDFKS